MSGGDEAVIGQWSRWERSFASVRTYEHPLQEVRLEITLVGPSGTQHTVDAFWDGGTTWRVRFVPDEVGAWSYRTSCHDGDNAGLHDQTGTFVCGPAEGATRFDLHGPVRVEARRRFLEHADGTPFFWLGDTAWNGPLLASDAEWDQYLQVRAAQQFTVVQWVATQWIGAPDGDRHGARAYQGVEQIQLNPAFFQRLDARVDAINDAGLLAVPVLLWAASWVRPYRDNEANPGYALPDEQAILLARYMVARWGAHHVTWILPGDGDYRGAAAERWRTIGRGVFGGRTHAPVSLHPGGLQWVREEFAGEDWLDIEGYQSGHSLNEESLRWLVEGPPATNWSREPIRPFINLEPPYEQHMDMASGGARRIDAHAVRRALYSSLLIAPTAGVTYGGHGIWGWDNGTTPPVAHPNTGVPRPWQDALHLPAAEQLPVLAGVFGGIPWEQLRPAQALIVEQPGHAAPSRMVVAAQSEAGGLVVVYTPEDGNVVLRLDGAQADLDGEWINAETGERSMAIGSVASDGTAFQAPTSGDWVLVLRGRGR